jgi:hypothetical protein
MALYYNLDKVLYAKMGITLEEYHSKDLLNIIRKNEIYIDVLKNMSYNCKVMLLCRFKKELLDAELYHIFEDYDTEKFWKFYNKICN